MVVLLRFTITEEEARNTFMKDISSTSAENSLLKTGTMKEGKAKKGKSEIYAIIKKGARAAKKSQRIQQFGFQQNNFLMSQKSSKRQNLRPMNFKEIILALIKKTENKIKEGTGCFNKKQPRADAEKIRKWEIWQLNLQIHLKIFYLKLEPGSI